MEEIPESKYRIASKSDTSGDKRSRNRRPRKRQTALSVAAAPGGRKNSMDVVTEPAPPLPGSPRIVAREEHCISRKNIDADALKVMRRLIGHGYQAFLVGGGVRDLLLNKQPKDFDIGTNASPEQVRALFRNSRSSHRSAFSNCSCLF